MASDQSSSPGRPGRGGAGKTSSRGKRRPVTIDLTAEEVARKEAGQGRDAAPASSEPGTVEPGSVASSSEGEDDNNTAASQPTRPAADTPTERLEEEVTEAVASAKAAQADPTLAGTGEGESEARTDKSPESAGSTTSAGSAVPPPGASGSRQPAAPARAGRGIGAMLVAAVVGGIVVAGLLYGLLVAGQLPVGTRGELRAVRDAVADAHNEITILETRLEESEAALSDGAGLAGTADALRERLDQVEARLAELANSATGAADGRDALGARIAELERQAGERTRNIGALSRDVGEAGDRLARLEELRTQVLDLRKLVETGAAGSDVALASLEESVNGLRERVDALAKASSTAVTDARLSALEAASGGVDVVARRLGTLEAEVDTLTTRVEQAVKSLSPEAPQVDAAIGTAIANLEPRFNALSDSLGDVSTRLSDLGETVEALKAGLSSTGERVETATAEQSAALDSLSARVGDVAREVDELRTRVDTPGALDQAALAVAVTRLKAAVDRGAPYAAELAAVSALTGDEFDLAPLKARADTGVPDKQTLLAAFPAALGDIRQTLASEDAPTDPIERVWTDLRSMVRIKSLDKDGPEAPAVQRLQEAVEASDLAAAHAAWQDLPAPAREASAAWAGDVAARLAIDAVVEKVTADVVSTLSRSTN